MADHPMLFSMPMILALLREAKEPGTGKTQTRRALKPQPTVHANGSWSWEGRNGGFVGAMGTHVDEGFPVSAAHWARIKPGDRVWCRETWAHYHTVNHIRRPEGGAFSEVSDGLAGYRADGHDTIEDFRDHIRLMSGCDLEAVEINGNRWRPSIHMPRWASRLTLYVSEVRVQRLQDISEEDALAEGVQRARRHVSGAEGQAGTTARAGYGLLWEQLNGPGSWEANPWVACYSFKPVLANIDTLEA